MSEELQFHIHQIVWAKIQQYPSWPAKIVNIFELNGKTVYKLNFFADPSYCYLHECSLTPFSSLIDQELIQEKDFKLEKAIYLAKIAYSKQHCLTSQQKHTNFIEKENEVDCLKFISVEQSSKEQIEIVSKIEQVYQKNLNQTININLGSIFITPQNVIEVLQSYHSKQNTVLSENLKRKQIISFQNELKQNLLLKFKLNGVDFIKLNLQHQSKPIQFKKILKKDKIKQKTHKFEIRQLCQRKIQKLLFQKGVKRHSSIELTQKIFNKIQKMCLHMPCSYDSTEFRQNFIRVVCQIAQNLRFFDEEDDQIKEYESYIMSIIQIQINEHKIDENSRGTHIPEINVM